MNTLLERLAQTDEQQEEFDIFVEKITELDEALGPIANSAASGATAREREMKKQDSGAAGAKVDPKKERQSEDKLPDAAAKSFYFYRTSSKNLFLSGKKKNISGRKNHIGDIKKLKRL